METRRSKLEELKKQKRSGKTATDVYREKMNEELKQKYTNDDDKMIDQLLDDCADDDLNGFIDKDVETERQLNNTKRSMKRINTKTAKEINIGANKKTNGMVIEDDRYNKEIFDDLMQNDQVQRPKKTRGPKNFEGLQDQFGKRNSKPKPTYNVSQPKHLVSQLMSGKETDVKRYKDVLLKTTEIDFFMMDVFEDPADRSTLYMTGKVECDKTYFSTCVKVPEIEREIYIVPRKGHTVGDVEEEIMHLLKHLLKRYKVQIDRVTKNYCFEMDLDLRNEEAEVLKISYPFSFPALNSLKQSGKTYKGVIGVTYTAVELFMLRMKLKGPMWVNLKNIKIDLDGKSFATNYFNIDINDYYRQIEPLSKETPPTFNLATIEVLNCPERKYIKAIMLGIYKDYNISTGAHQTVDFIIWKNKNLKSERFQCEHDKRGKLKKILYEFNNEHELVHHFYTQYSKLNLDIFVAHDLQNSHLNFIINKIQQKGSKGANLFSILNKVTERNRNDFNSNYRFRNTFMGKMLVDTRSLTKEIIKLPDYSIESIIYNYDKMTDTSKSDDKIEQLTYNAYHTFNILNYTKILPLTLELSKVAGCLWHLSLEQARSRRNEVLLMHKFYNSNYLVPDKPKRKNKDGDKAKYAGGKVLEPKAGFYDHYVVLVDFNSLYPSIIRQYSICFNTVIREFSEPGIEKMGRDASVMEEEKYEEEMENPLAHIETGEEQNAILPGILTFLIERRKQVKNDLKKEKNQKRKAELNIKQQAFKLIANSIYGCLGFSSSRFYAKKMAELITCIGRKLLDSSIKRVTELGFDVIYGDTDSIMIDTKQNNVLEGIFQGFEIKKNINSQFAKKDKKQILEVEVDGVYKKLLLLKKKKYAGLMVTNFSNIFKSTSAVEERTKLEVKGLDLVRRDWSQITKQVSTQVLNILMDKGDLVDVYVYLKNVNDALDEYVKKDRKFRDKVTLGDITIYGFLFQLGKQLNKKPDDYPKNTNLPHVKVAYDLKKYEKKLDEQMVNHQINYIMTIRKNGKEQIPMYPKHFQENTIPDENNEGEPVIDVAWYKNHQLYNPIKRILDPIEGFEENRLKEAFNIKTHHEAVAFNEADNLCEKILDRALDNVPLIYSQTNFDNDHFKVKCKKCQSKCFGFALTCNNVGVEIDKEPFGMGEYNQRIMLIVNKLYETYMRPNYVCPNCTFSTKMCTFTNECPWCEGGIKLKKDADEVDFLAHLSYLKQLIIKTIESTENINKTPLYSIVEYITKIMDQYDYESKNLGEAFKLYIKHFEGQNIKSKIFY